jgi:hypothetical protein
VTRDDGERLLARYYERLDDIVACFEMDGQTIVDEIVETARREEHE